MQKKQDITIFSPQYPEIFCVPQAVCGPHWLIPTEDYL